MTYYGPEPIKKLYETIKAPIDFVMSIRDDFKNNQFSEWLYSDWDAGKYDTYNLLNMIPGVHQYMDYLLDIRADNEYLNRYGMDYSDIHDPRKLHQTSSAGALYSTGYRMISKNISKLYDD